MSEFNLPMLSKGDGLVHAARSFGDGRWGTACGWLLVTPTQVDEHPVSCKACAKLLADPQAELSEDDTAPIVIQTRKHVTIPELVAMSYGTAKANGFHDQDHLPVSPQDAYGQVAGMAWLLLPWARAVEAIRKGGDVEAALSELAGEARRFQDKGADGAAQSIANVLFLEPWQWRTMAWLSLKVTELVEAMEAVINRDPANFVEELADTVIRMGDSIGAINDDPNHPFNGIDLEAAILAKNERNKARGYRHGGKRA